MINQLIIVTLHAQIQIFFRTGWGGGGSRDIYVCRVLGGLGVGSDAYFLVILQCNVKKCVYLCIPDVDPPPPTAFL